MNKIVKFKKEEEIKKTNDSRITKPENFRGTFCAITEIYI